MANTDNSLLNEKYRPVTLDTYVGNAKLKASIAAAIKKQRYPKLFILWTSWNRKDYFGKTLY